MQMDTGELPASIKNCVKWTEVCKASYMMCMVILHVAQNMSLICEGIITFTLEIIAQH